MSAQLSRCVAVYSRHFVASRINAPAVVVAVVFTLDHIVTTQTTMGWTKSLLSTRWTSITRDMSCSDCTGVELQCGHLQIDDRSHDEVDCTRSAHHDNAFHDAPYGRARVNNFRNIPISKKPRGDKSRSPQSSTDMYLYFTRAR